MSTTNFAATSASALPKRVALVCLHTSPLMDPGQGDAGGMNVVVRQSALALSTLGVKVDIYTRRSDPNSPTLEVVNDQVRLIRLTAGPAAELAKSDMEQAVLPFAAQLQACFQAGITPLSPAEVAARNASPEQCRQEPAKLILPRPDVFHSHHWFSALAAEGVAKRLQVPHLFSFHSVAAPADATSLAAGEVAESQGRIIGERRAARNSDLIIAVSEAEAQTISERYAVPTEKIRVLLPGVDTCFFHPRDADSDCEDIAAIAGLPPELLTSKDLAPPPVPYLLFAARLQPLKGAELAIETFAQLQHKYPELHLVLAGEASADFAGYEDELKTLATKLEVAQKVDFRGALPRPFMAHLMRYAELFLFPSWSETFGLVALEAESSGTPVAAWAGAGGVKSALSPQSLLLSDRDPAHWSAAIDHLISSPERLHRARLDARAFAEKNSWQANAKKLGAIYSACLKPRPTSADPWELLAQSKRVMVVHAHPDDETLATSPLLLWLKQQGVNVQLITCTRGEQGQIVPGSIPTEGARPLPAIRHDELSAAISILGVHRHEYLGEKSCPPVKFGDSGMRWIKPGVAGPAEDVAGTAFTSMPLSAEIKTLADTCARLKPEIIISYDQAGTYGHPDHVRAHTVACETAKELGLPFIEFASEESYAPTVDSPVALPECASPYIWRTFPDYVESIRTALSCYRTQLTVLPASLTPEPVVRVRHVGGEIQDVIARQGLKLSAD